VKAEGNIIKEYVQGSVECYVINVDYIYLRVAINVRSHWLNTLANDGHWSQFL